MTVVASVVSPLRTLEHEELLVRKGERSGLYIAIAVHRKSKNGTAGGGCRMWPYADPMEAIEDALRLARAMTAKMAVAKMTLGGAKGVICLEEGPPPSGQRRKDIMLDFADTMNVLDGRFYTGEDVGTTPEDMNTIASRSKFVYGLDPSRGGSGDPSEATAYGTEVAIRACCKKIFGTRDMNDRSVAVVGLGNVGAKLARSLYKQGARLVISDVNEDKRRLVEELPGVTWAEPSAALRAEVDVLAPCALSGIINEELLDELNCRVICGSSNSTLSSDDVAEKLMDRSILYAPDFISNSGGAINIAVLEMEGGDEAQAKRRIEGIEATLLEVIEDAEKAGVSPLAVAYDLAEKRLAETA